jgi:hypothetical protein
MQHHTPLSKREGPLSSDIADAVEELVSDAATLPVALSKEDIINRLMRIASRDDNGMELPVSSIHRRAVFDLFHNRLTNTIILQSGYKRYESTATPPIVIVPVTEYFFKFVVNTIGTFDFAAMTTFDTGHSLPRRPQIAKHESGEQRGEPRRDENNEIVQYGEIAGIIVFPSGSEQPLLRTWLKRRVNNIIATTAKVTNQIQAARSDKNIDRTKRVAADLAWQLREGIPGRDE